MQSSTRARSTLRFETVKNGEYDDHLELLKRLDGDAIELESALDQITWQEFMHLFHRVGEVITIYRGKEIAGFYWIEERGHIVHLHSLILKPGYQGQGIGGEVLEILVNTYRRKMDAIEVGVHESNTQSLAFYMKEGFIKRGYVAESGFIILGIDLRGDQIIKLWS